MKTKMNKLLSLMLACVMLLAPLPALSALAEEIPEIIASGSSSVQSNGDHYHWTFDSAGTLTVSGAGKLFRNTNSGAPCWRTDAGIQDNSIKRVVVEDGITDLNCIFAGYRNMTEIDLPDTLVRLSYYEFYCCTSLRSLYIGADVTTISSGAFAGCPALTQFTVSEENGLFASEDGVLFNGDKSTLISYPTAKPGAAYVVPESVTAIYGEAFYGNLYLQHITLPNGLQTLGSHSFYCCKSLTDIEIPYGVTTIPSCCFTACEQLQNVTLPESVTCIGSHAFDNCRELQAINLPSSLTKIESQAFYRCDKLSSVEIPVGLTSIANDAYQGCTSVSSITAAPGNPVFHSAGNLLIKTADKMCILNGTPFEIPEDGSVTAIGGCAFYGYQGTTLHLPTCITAVRNIAFGSSRITDVYYDGTLEEYQNIEGITYSYIGLGNVKVHFTAYSEPPVFAEGYCGEQGHETDVSWALNSEMTVFISGTGKIRDDWTAGSANYALLRATSLVVNEGVTSVNSRAFYGFDGSEGARCARLESVTLPASMETIGAMAFAECYYLRTVTIPRNSQLRSIGSGAFEQCSFTEIFLPGSVTEIDPSAFWGTGVTIYGYADTYAQTFAQQYGYPFVAVEHVPGAAVRENEVPATCTEAGSYDEVVFCTECFAEISRTHTEIPAAGHSWGEWEVIRQATTEEEGLMRRTCLNDPSHVEEEVIPKLQPQTNTFRQFIQRIRDFFSNIVDWFSRLFRF